MLLPALLALAAPSSVSAPIVAASMFKNGYSMVLREIPVSGSGSYRLNSIPAAALGTLWFAASDGTEIDSVKTVTDASAGEMDASSLAEIVNANVGRDVKLGVKQGDQVTGEVVQGKLLSVSGEVVVVKTATQVLALPKAIITSIASPTGDLLYKVHYALGRRTLEFTVKGKPGHISMVSLERGLTWVPGYAVDVSNKEKLSLVAKSTVMNDDEDLKNVSAKFVTGFPNVPYAAFQDPLVSGETVDQFLGLASAAFGGMGGGGFGGGRDMNRSKLAFANQAAPAASMEAIGNGMPMSPVAGQQLEDLFFYNQPNVTLEKGQRSYFVLFRMEAAYKHVYTCDIPDPVQNNVEFRPIAEEPPLDVWHTLNFKNTSGRPLTTGPATTFKDGEIMGQDTMNYVSSGADAELKVTKALDISAANTEEEISRERGAIKNSSNYPIFDLVALKGTIVLTNRKSESVTVKVRHDFTGELTGADNDPVTKKTTKGLRDTNGAGKITWTKTLASGQSLTLTYSYKLYVRSQ